MEHGSSPERALPAPILSLENPNVQCVQPDFSAQTQQVHHRGANLDKALTQVRLTVLPAKTASTAPGTALSHLVSQGISVIQPANKEFRDFAALVIIVTGLVRRLALLGRTHLQVLRFVSPFSLDNFWLTQLCLLEPALWATRNP